MVHQQLHVIRNTAHRPSTQASYTASRVQPKRKISCHCDCQIWQAMMMINKSKCELILESSVVSKCPNVWKVIPSLRFKTQTLHSLVSVGFYPNNNSFLADRNRAGSRFSTESSSYSTTSPRIRFINGVYNYTYNADHNFILFVVILMSCFHDLSWIGWRMANSIIIIINIYF